MGATSARWVIVLVLATPAPAAEARPIRVEFEAVVTQVVDDFGLLTGVEVGGTVSGSYTYDDSVAPASANELGATFTFEALPEAGFDLAAGELSLELVNALGPEVPLQIAVIDDAIRGIGLDRYAVRWVEDDGQIVRQRAAEPEVIRNSVGLFIEGQLFSDPSFDRVPPPPLIDMPVSERFAHVSFIARAESPSCPLNAICPDLAWTESSLRAGLTSLRIVPEASVLPLLGIALAAFLAARSVRAGSGP